MSARLTRIALLLALAALLAIQFWTLRAPSRLHLPEPQRLVTANPKIGIHTRLAGLGDEAYVARSLQQVREMGAGWIVDLFPGLARATAAIATSTKSTTATTPPTLRRSCSATGPTACAT